ncbi:alpha/beta fold hydrolase [Clostridium botulinum]|uniref:alpha/beta fold hydrolase n=1 Tax=Clostridium botulinum TaxID=1491 RepID=UPI00064C7CBE|nr:alpha/beta hydrolase [Clostridium botulinum]KLU76816.1 hypothetical protein CBC3_01690 [Clostridium botulinum V891]
MYLYHKIIKSNKLNAEWVIMVHAIGSNHNNFKKQISEFSENYNLLLLDLRGHGMTKNLLLSDSKEKILEVPAKDIIELMDKLYIEKAHFVGISLGSMVISQIALTNPERIISMVLGGGIVRYVWKGRFLLFLGKLTKKFIPYMFTYTLFAYAVIPNKKHKISRKFFIEEAKKLGTKEFLAWVNIIETFEKTYPIDRIKMISIPKIYIMGEYDHMFLPPVKKYIEKNENTEICILPNCGHICNIDDSYEFNRVAIQFMKNYTVQY